MIFASWRIGAANQCPLGLVQLRLVIFLVLVVAVGAAAWLFRTGIQLGADIRHIVLISIDTCRADYLSCYGYRRPISPHIDQVAREGILFRNAVSPVPLTLPAHSSMLTGTNPPYHGVHDNVDYRVGPSNVTLAELLKQNGFATGAVIGAFVLDSKFGLDQGFDNYHDHFDEKLSTVGIPERRGEEVSRYGLQWLAEHHSEPFFLFLHYYDPHYDYDPPEPFKPTSATDVASRYAAEIAYTDACIGQVINQLKSLGIYDSTLIIITSDHGEALGGHSESTHGYFIYNETVKVPLVIKLAGQHPPRQIDDLVGIVDILPTICHLIGIPVPPQAVGEDLSPYLTNSADNRSERSYYCESWYPTHINCNSLTGITTDRWKYIQTTRPELYDLVADPRESNNLVGTEPEQAHTLQGRLKRMLTEQTRADADSRMALDEQARQRLESLGYMVGGGNSHAPDHSRDDPKDFIDFHTAYTTLFVLTHQEKYAEAEELCKMLIGQRPDVSQLYFRRGVIARDRQDLAGAVAHFSKAVELAPDDLQSHYNLGITLSSLGRFDEAITRLRQILVITPDDDEVHYNLGITLKSQGQLDEAIHHFRQALEIRPDAEETHNNLGLALRSQGRLEEAFAHFQKAIQINPDLARAHNNLGSLLSFQDRLDEAIDHFRQALRIAPDLAEAHNNLANALRSQGRLDEAIRCYLAALRADPEFADAHYNLGNTLATDRRFDEAISHYQAALRVRPDHPASYALGSALRDRGSFEEAISHYRQLLQRDPEDARAHFDLARTLSAQGSLDQAIGHYREAIRIKPDWPAPLGKLAWILATHPDTGIRDAPRAIELAQQAAEITENQNPVILDTLAAAYAAAGWFDRAVQTAEDALALASQAQANDLAPGIRQRLELYRREKPFRAPRSGPEDAGR